MWLVDNIMTDFSQKKNSSKVILSKMARVSFFLYSGFLSGHSVLILKCENCGIDLGAYNS